MAVSTNFLDALHFKSDEATDKMFDSTFLQFSKKVLILPPLSWKISSSTCKMTADY